MPSKSPLDACLWEACLDKDLFRLIRLEDDFGASLSTSQAGTSVSGNPG